MFDLPLIDLPPVAPRTFLWTLPVVVPIGVWIAWSDMKSMRIPNQAVAALAWAWALLAWIVFPWEVWLFGLPLMAFAYILGGFLHAAGAFGAGDLKMAAAMSPYFIGADARPVMTLIIACLLAALVAHRALRLTPFRRTTSDWESWENPKFPAGLALSGVLIFHPLLAAFLS